MLNFACQTDRQSSLDTVKGYTKKHQYTLISISKLGVRVPCGSFMGQDNSALEGIFGLGEGILVFL